MKLLIVTQVLDKDDPAYFGFFHAWVAEFSRHCEQVTVICLREGAHTLPHNVHVYSLGKERGRPMWGRVAYSLNFLRLAWRLRNEYETVFVHMNPEYLVIAGWLWRLMGKRTGLWYLHKSVTPALRIAVLFANVIFSASAESFRLRTRKLQLVGHGIDPMFKPVPHVRTPVLRVVYWGRVSPSKRIAELLDAIGALVRSGTPTMLTVVGAPARPSDEAYLSELKHLAEQLPPSTVRFAGGVPHREISAYANEADVCVNISLTQSMDKTVLEAMAAGVPVVSSNDAFRSVLEPYGLFAGSVEPRVLAEQISRAAQMDPSPLVEYVRANHSLSRLIPAILQVFETLP